MADLAAKDSYIQKLASKLFSQQEKEPKKRPFVHFKGKSDTDPSKKKKKQKKKNLKEKCGDEKTPKPQQKPPPAVAQKSPAAAKPTPQTGGNVNTSFSTVDVLRKRLHEKIEESRGQGAPKDPSSEAVLAKRAKRKLERERRKRKNKEFQMKKLAEKNGQEPPAEVKKEEPTPPASDKRMKTSIVFNNFETVEEEFETKVQKKMKKKMNLKGNITPLTGRNYKQLLSRVEARKAKLEQLREKDEQKASEMEKKIKWTNLLYKAEGIKIKDDEDMLRASLKRKEKMRTQRKKTWEQRSEHVIEKMQKRQDKRKKNIQKRKQVKIEKKKNKLRKKGRVLAEDLKKATG
ncbi:surfeit locus protein 6 [Austrofundulus limnaeus]|uniref:Surfeit locus protein 6 n=1 Tax=Austrofundulus limnaeus TaxID=52670 RepID=A0A2I4B2Q6_AUSLI|nr:PREDICTED: surfeit locus protein 6 [Austrofundulus limnaeus]